MRGRILAAIVSLAALAGCGTIDFSALRPGTFSGGLFVMWVGEGGPSGSGLFVYVPDPHDPLTFKRLGRPASEAIRPRMMYTDGGSIPRIAQAFKGFSPWGYAPAYMIHDWLFTAHHCVVDGSDDPAYASVRDVSFEQSAEILGEAIQGLIAAKVVRKDDFAGGAITGAVNGPIARALWDKRGACAELQVKPEHVAAAEAAIPGASTLAARRTLRPGAAPAGPPAKIITRIGF